MIGDTCGWEYFTREYRLRFPIGVDQPGSNAIPGTMEAYAMRGTPTLIIIDQLGQLRANHFGRPADMQVAYEIASLIDFGATLSPQDEEKDSKDGKCGEDGCELSMDTRRCQIQNRPDQ